MSIFSIITCRIAAYVGIYQKMIFRHTNRGITHGTSIGLLLLARQIGVFFYNNIIIFIFYFLCVAFFSLVNRLRCPLFISPPPSRVGYYIYRWHFRRIAVLPTP